LNVERIRSLAGQETPLFQKFYVVLDLSLNNGALQTAKDVKKK